MNEADFIDRLRKFATHPAARGLMDDAAVLGDLVLTHDLLVEGVHFLPTCPPADVAWKLLAVNLSDLAAKGADPLGVLLGFPLGDAAWDAAFADGLQQALAYFAVPLLGGDTVTGPRVLSLTAFGCAAIAPARSGAQPGDTAYVTGRIGAAGLGVAAAREGRDSPHLAAYRRPVPRLAEGRALRPHVHAMMDISDGLLIDAARMAAASDLALELNLAAIPLAEAGLDPLVAVTSGDDYELLFACATPPPVPATAIGRFAPGAGMTLVSAGRPVPLPDRLGWLHG